MLPSFSKHGFEVADAPKDVHKALQDRLLQYGDATPHSDAKVDASRRGADTGARQPPHARQPSSERERETKLEQGCRAHTHTPRAHETHTPPIHSTHTRH